MEEREKTNDVHYGSVRDFSSPFRQFIDQDGSHADKVSEIRKGYYPLIARIAIMAIFLDLLLLILFTIFFYFSTGLSLLAILVIITILKLAYFCYFAVNITYRWSQTYFQFENNRLIKLVGVYNPQQTIYNLHELNSVEVKIGILGRMLKYGHLILFFKLQGGEQQQLQIPYVIEPLKLKSYLSKYL